MMPARRYIAVVQATEGYPAPGEPLEAAPPDGPAPPVIHTVVRAEEYERLYDALDRVAALRVAGTEDVVEWSAVLETARRIAREALGPSAAA